MIAMRNRWVKAGIGICFLVGFSLELVGPAESGQFYEKHGVAIDGFDPVAYFEDHRAIKGDPALTVIHKGSTFLFASSAHQTAFARTPERFTPQFGGYCAYGVAEGVKAAVDGHMWEIVEGRLYLNHDPHVQAKWTDQRMVLFREAEANWPRGQLEMEVYP